MPLKIITTEDGSHSLFDEQLNETYHSTRGARGESLHVFIEEGLDHWLSTHASKQIRILEIGLGTGLNAFLTAQVTERDELLVHFTSLEPFPVAKEIYDNLNFHQSEEEKGLFQKIHTSRWEELIPISKCFNLFKTQSRLEEFETIRSYDLIYFDAFAPSKQPEVWSLDNLKKCHSLLDVGGVLTTYCAQGQFKRNLADVGFKVETLQGAMGKKEMIRATKS